jgi:molybdate transport system substrate-binding protein
MKITYLAMSVLLAAGVHAADVHVFASNGVKAVVDELKEKAEKATGTKLNIDFGTTSGLKQKIEAGESFDVTFLTVEAMDDLVKSGKVAAATRQDIARSWVGVGIKKGAAKPDIHSAAALKQTLLKSKSITFAQDGASRTYLMQMFDKMGIADQLKPKIMLEQGSARSAAKVAAGEAEMIMTLESEILPAPGVEFVGRLPMDIGYSVAFAVGASPKAKDMEASKAVVKYFSGPAVKATLKEKGMEAPKK